jgi:hypothetical protein
MEMSINEMPKIGSHMGWRLCPKTHGQSHMRNQSTGGILALCEDSRHPVARMPSSTKRRLTERQGSGMLVTALASVFSNRSPGSRKPRG